MTRERILDAALEVIGEHGVAGLTNRRVAAAAGLSLGSLTYHFSSQTDLLRESLLRYASAESERIRTLAEDLAASVTDVAGAAAAVERTLAEMTMGATELGVFEVYLQAARDPALHDAARDCFAAYEQVAATLLGLLGVADAQRLAPHTVSLVLGAQLRRIATGAAETSGIADGLLALLGGGG